MPGVQELKEGAIHISDSVSFLQFSMPFQKQSIFIYRPKIQIKEQRQRVHHLYEKPSYIRFRRVYIRGCKKQKSLERSYYYYLVHFGNKQS